jgi:hypothetical protein
MQSTLSRGRSSALKPCLRSIFFAHPVSHCSRLFFGNALLEAMAGVPVYDVGHERYSTQSDHQQRFDARDESTEG